MLDVKCSITVPYAAVDQVKQVILSEVVNQFRMKLKEMIHRVIHANPILADHLQHAEIMVALHRVSAYKDTLVHHPTVDQNASLMMIVRRDSLVLTINAKTLALVLVAVSTKF